MILLTADQKHASPMLSDTYQKEQPTPNSYEPSKNLKMKSNKPCMSSTKNQASSSIIVNYCNTQNTRNPGDSRLPMNSDG
jgi:hypothetical protein